MPNACLYMRDPARHRTTEPTDTDTRQRVPLRAASMQPTENAQRAERVPSCMDAMPRLHGCGWVGTADCTCLITCTNWEGSTHYSTAVRGGV